MKRGESKAVEKTVRKLKTAQGQKSASTSAQPKANAPRKRKITRNNNMFKRF